MRKVIYILILSFCLASCTAKVKQVNVKTQKDSELEFLSQLQSTDSTEVLSMADTFMDLLKAKKLDEAVGMIYVLHNNIVYKKSDEYTEELKNRFTIMPVEGYEREYFSFSTEGNNDICYKTWPIPQTSGSDSGFLIRLTLNPVLVDGVWYLTFKDGYQSSKMLPVEKQIHELAPAPAKIRTNKPAE